MKHILRIAFKDIRQVLRDRMSLMFLLIMPIAFTLMFGFFFSVSPSTPGDPRLPVGYLDLDQSRASAELKSLLESSTVIRLEENPQHNPADLEKQVGAEKLAGALIVPAGYGSGLSGGKAVELDLVAAVSAQTASTLEEEVQNAAGRMQSAARIARAASQGKAGLYEDAFSKALTAWQQPALSLRVESTVQIASKTASVSPVSTAQTSPGMMIQFAMAGLISAAQVMVHERKTRCMQRLLTTAVARYQILLGHFLAIFLTCLSQLALLIVFGQLALKLDYLGQPLATLVMAVATALFIAALGLLIGALAKGDDQAVIFSLIPMFVFAGLGGAWMPLEMTGQTVQIIGHLTPVAWAMDGFKNIIARGLGLSSIWLPAGALLGYALLFVGLAAWKFKFE